jgi:hypothetical protein
MRQVAGKVSVAGPLVSGNPVNGVLSYPLSFNIPFAGYSDSFGLQAQGTYGPHGHFNVLWNGVANGFYVRDDGGMAANFSTFKNSNPAGAYAVSATSVDPNFLSYGVNGVDQAPSNVGHNFGGIGVWGDTQGSDGTSTAGVAGTSDFGIAVYGENNTDGSLTPTAEFINDSSAVGEVVFDAYGSNLGGDCNIDISGNLNCSGWADAQGSHGGMVIADAIGTQGGNTDLAGVCNVLAGGGLCAQFTRPYTTAPVCVVSDPAGNTPLTYSVTPAKLTITSVPVAASINYICISLDSTPPGKKGHMHHKGLGKPAVHAGSPEHK